MYSGTACWRGFFAAEGVPLPAQGPPPSSTPSPAPGPTGPPCPRRPRAWGISSRPGKKFLHFRKFLDIVFRALIVVLPQNALKAGSNMAIGGNSSLPLFKRLVLTSVLLPSLLLTAGCGEQGSWAEDGAGDPQEPDLSPGAIAVYNPSKRGMVQAAMEAAGTSFVTDNYGTVLIHVDGSSTASLVPVVTHFLNEGKQVVLDSNGGHAERSAIGELAAAVAGIAAQEAALSIVQDAPGAFTVTPIADATAAAGLSEYGPGNTPVAVLGTSSPALGSLDDSVSMLSTDTITKSGFQGSGQPAPPIVPSYVDNKVTHIQKGSSGSLLKRYLFVGNPQECPVDGTNNCPMSWGESYSRAVAQGTTISVNLSNKLTEKLTGSVTLGYSLTVTKTHTLTWSNGTNIQPGWTARPVSYLWRKSGYGDVKNAYVFKSRTKTPSACRPSGGCYRITDLYERQPNTIVGTWSANIAQNQGAPTSSWNTFRGAVDPNVYTFDR